MAAGLHALGSRADAAYVSSCDVPFLHAAFVARIIAELDDYDLVMPRDGKYHHPLAAVYRTRLAGRIRALIAADRLSPSSLLEESGARGIDVADLRAADPSLQSLRNINTRAEYEAALHDAGFAPGAG
jgi:molybdopterin-guanine dinucleotide biosynthesis protein A